MSLLRRMLCLGNPCPLICVVSSENNSGLGHNNAEYNANLCTAMFVFCNSAKMYYG